MLVIGIFGILTSVVIFNYGNFNSNIIMSNLAYEVALEIRQAQVYSLGVKGTGEGLGSSTFNTRYGVFFDLNSENDFRFLSFSDFYPVNSSQDDIDTPDGDGVCDFSTDVICSITSAEICDYECIKLSRLVSGIKFNKLCVTPEGTSPVNLVTGECNAGGEVDNLNITFARPYTNSIIKVNDRIDLNGNLDAGIVINSTAGSQKAVIVRSSGQISVENIKNKI